VSVLGHHRPGVQHGGCAPRPPGRGRALIWRCAMSFVLGLDLGQSMDYSALVVVEQILAPPAQPVYEVPLLFRWELGTPYPAIIRTLERTLARPPLAGYSDLVADHTGCGRPVVDQLRQVPLTVQAVSLHGGVTTSHVGMNWSVPKRDLVGVVQVVL